MEERFSWKQMPNSYYASHYNDDDLKEGRTFVIIDHLYDKEYPFPIYRNEVNEHGFKTQVLVIDSAILSQEFYNWICRTAPDFAVDIPKKFMTPELIDICIDHSSKGWFIKEVPNLTQEQAIRFVKRFPYAIWNIPKEYITKEMAYEVIEKEPQCLEVVPKELRTPELCKICYQKLSYTAKISFVKKGLFKDIMTSEMLCELINNETSVVKMYLDDGHSLFWSQISEKIITPDIAVRMVEISSDSIFAIPKNKDFFTLEMMKRAVENDITAIRNIPDEFLTDELIIYAIKLNALALSYLPQKRRTKELCELAFSITPKVLRNMPNRFKTYDMCKIAVIHDSKLIKYVPVEILTKQFLEDLRSMNVLIPDKHIGYVNECLQVHEKTGMMNQGKKINIKEDNQTLKANVPVEIKNISIETVADYFSTKVLNRFKDVGITNLEQLFEFSKKGDFITYFGNSSMFDEVSNTIRLLRCKYLNEQPLIDINDEELTSTELYKLLGLSIRSSNALCRNHFCDNAKQFFEKMKSATGQYELYFGNSIGNVSITEITKKANIIIEYYENKKIIEESKEDESLTETLETLKEELQRLRDERKSIDEQIDIVLAKIQQKNLGQVKGGVSR